MQIPHPEHDKFKFGARTTGGELVHLRVARLSEKAAEEIEEIWTRSYHVLVNGVEKGNIIPPEPGGEAFVAYFGYMQEWCRAWREHRKKAALDDGLGCFALLSESGVEAVVRLGAGHDEKIVRATGGEYVYVKYLHSAPGNQQAIWDGFGKHLSPKEKATLRGNIQHRPLKGCGKFLILYAIMESYARKWEGRAALSPLKDDSFSVRRYYVDHCWMEEKEGLPAVFYTPAGAARFWRGQFDMGGSGSRPPALGGG